MRKNRTMVNSMAEKDQIKSPILTRDEMNRNCRASNPKTAKRLLFIVLRMVQKIRGVGDDNDYQKAKGGKGYSACSNVFDESNFWMLLYMGEIG